MSVDVLNYQQLEQAELLLASAQTQIPFGRFGFGEELGQKIGVGFEPDGLRDYLPSDDSRRIDWIATAKRGDGGIFLRQFYEDQNALTVLVSDVPTQARYAETLGDPLSARSLGLVVANFVLKNAARSTPVVASWTNGYKDMSPDTRAVDGQNASKKLILDGLDSVIAAKQLEEMSKETKGIFRRKPAIELPETETIYDALERARVRSMRISDAARFVIVSDFKVGDDVFDLMTRMKRHSEIVAVQITNPLMRELDPRVRVLRSADGRDISIETQGQRDAYNAKVTEISSKRKEKIKNSSNSLFIVDTMSPVVARVA